MSLLSEEEKETIISRHVYLTTVKDKIYFKDGLNAGSEAQHAKDQKRIEQVFEFLEYEFGYFDEPNELAKIIIDDGGYYGSEGRVKKYLKFKAKYLAKIKEE